ERRVRYLHRSGGGRPGNKADDGNGTGRWSRLLAGWKVHLLQLGTYRPDADLADEAGRQRPGTGDLRRIQQLVRASFAGRKVPGFPLLREGCDRPSGKQGRVASYVDSRRREDSGPGATIRGARHHKRPLLV